MVLSDYKGLRLIESPTPEKWGLPAFSVVGPGIHEKFYGETAHSDAERLWHDLVIKRIYLR